jgi:hypothetical protein
MLHFKYIWMHINGKNQLSSCMSKYLSRISPSELNVRIDTGCRVAKLRINLHISFLKSTTTNRLCVTHALIRPVLGTTEFWLRYFDHNHSIFRLMYTSWGWSSAGHYFNHLWRSHGHFLVFLIACRPEKWSQGCSRIGCWTRHLSPRRTRWQGSGEYSITSRFLMYTPHQTLFRWSNQVEWDGRDEWHVLDNRRGA